MKIHKREKNKGVKTRRDAEFNACNVKKVHFSKFWIVASRPTDNRVQPKFLPGPGQYRLINRVLL